MKVFCNKCEHYKWISIFSTEFFVTGNVCKLSRYTINHPTYAEEAYLSCEDTNAKNECKNYKKKCSFMSKIKKRFFTKKKYRYEIRG